MLACGRQVLGAITIFFGYYVAGLPLGFLFTYKFDFGIIGKIWNLLGYASQPHVNTVPK